MDIARMLCVFILPWMSWATGRLVSIKLNIFHLLGFQRRQTVYCSGHCKFSNTKWEVNIFVKIKQGCLKSGLWGVDGTEYHEVLNGWDKPDMIASVTIFSWLCQLPPPYLDSFGIPGAPAPKCVWVRKGAGSPAAARPQHHSIVT